MIDSRVGWPLYGESQTKQEYIKGEKLDGFTVPFNIFDNIYGLFHRFRLWHSTSGICVLGPDHQPVQVQSHYIFTQEPVLVGDSVFGERVLSSYCQYVERLGLWSCRITYGNLPQPYAEPQELALLHSYLTAQESIAQSLIDYIHGVVTKLNSDTELTSVLITTLKEKTQEDIKSILKSVQEKFWH